MHRFGGTRSLNLSYTLHDFLLSWRGQCRPQVRQSGRRYVRNTDSCFIDNALYLNTSLPTGPVVAFIGIQALYPERRRKLAFPCVAGFARRGPKIAFDVIALRSCVGYLQWPRVIHSTIRPDTWVPLRPDTDVAENKQRELATRGWSRGIPGTDIIVYYMRRIISGLHWFVGWWAEVSVCAVRTRNREETSFSLYGRNTQRRRTHGTRHTPSSPLLFLLRLFLSRDGSYRLTIAHA